jgi:hypothetical protein
VVLNAEGRISGELAAVLKAPTLERIRSNLAWRRRDRSTGRLLEPGDRLPMGGAAAWRSLT